MQRKPVCRGADDRGEEGGSVGRFGGARNSRGCVLVNQVACCVHLTKRQFVVIFVVQDVHQVRVEGVHVVKVWELVATKAQAMTLASRNACAAVPRAP